MNFCSNLLIIVYKIMLFLINPINVCLFFQSLINTFYTLNITVILNNSSKSLKTTNSSYQQYEYNCKRYFGFIYTSHTFSLLQNEEYYKESGRVRLGVKFLVSHRAPPQVADRGLPPRYG